MCFTSQENLMKGLDKSGLKVRLVNKDNPDLHKHAPWQHIEVSSSTTPGFKSSSLGKSMNRWLVSCDKSSNCVAIVDWRLIKYLHATLSNKSIPWILLDRSPPADKGLLAKLQWPIWKKSWRLVSKTSNSCGSVVSPSHGKFVQDFVSISDEKIFTLPAGVDLEKFTPSKKTGEINLIYHGRLDRHRGVLALPMLVSKAKAKSIEVRLTLIGEGDCANQLRLIADSDDSITVYSQMPQDQLATHLQKATIGLLPMPDWNIWSISSPLKRGEYCASGLLIYGIDHDGHRFADTEKDWMKLVPQHDFHDEAIKWFSSLTEGELEKYSQQSRNYAEDNLSWQLSVDSLLSAIHELKS